MATSLQHFASRENNIRFPLTGNHGCVSSLALPKIYQTLTPGNYQQKIGIENMSKRRSRTKRDTGRVNAPRENYEKPSRRRRRKIPQVRGALAPSGMPRTIKEVLRPLRRSIAKARKNDEMLTMRDLDMFLRPTVLLDDRRSDACQQRKRKRRAVLLAKGTVNRPGGAPGPYKPRKECK